MRGEAPVWLCAYRESDELPDKRSGQRVKVAGQTSRWLVGSGKAGWQACRRYGNTRQ